jgi:hypothetical protein
MLNAKCQLPSSAILYLAEPFILLCADALSNPVPWFFLTNDAWELGRARTP